MKEQSGTGLFDRSNAPNKDLFAKAYEWSGMTSLKGEGLYPYFRPFDVTEGPQAIIDGKRVVMLGSNNYLGLTTHPKVVEAAVAATKKYGPSVTGSRFVNGTLRLHVELEEKLAERLGKEAALVLTTGYMVNLAALSALLPNDKTIAVVDQLVHASVYDGVRLAQSNGARLIRFVHNSADDLEEHLDSLDANEGAIVITEGVFSAEGKLGALKDVVKTAKRKRARVFVDDAHGFGVLGELGRGSSHHLGVASDVDLIGGTFSKSLASIGGWLVGERKIIDYVKHFAPSFMFTAACSPPNTAAALAALQVIEEEPWRPTKVREHAAFMAKELKRLGFEVGEPEAAIVPVLVRDDRKCLAMWRALVEEQGVYTNPFISPGVPPNSALLRTSYMATHEMSHLEKALDAFQKVGKQFSLI